MEWRRAVVPAAALLPLRVFFGATFVYAGLDKLLDPGFFDPDNAASDPGPVPDLRACLAARPADPRGGADRADSRRAHRARGARCRNRCLDRPCLPPRCARRSGDLAALLPDRVVDDASLLLRQRPALHVRLADARAGRSRQPLRAEFGARRCSRRAPRRHDSARPRSDRSARARHVAHRRRCGARALRPQRTVARRHRHWSVARPERRCNGRSFGHARGECVSHGHGSSAAPHRA